MLSVVCYLDFLCLVCFMDWLVYGGIDVEVNLVISFVKLVAASHVNAPNLEIACSMH